VVLEFLDTDIFHLSAENCVAFLDPLIESWDIDLATFGLEIVLNHSLVPGQAKRFAFVEQEVAQPVGDEPGLQEFLQDSSLSGCELMNTNLPRSAGRSASACSQSHRPPRLGMCTSVMTASNRWLRTASNASRPSVAVATSHPSRAKERAIASLRATLSSTMRAENTRASLCRVTSFFLMRPTCGGDAAASIIPECSKMAHQCSHPPPPGRPNHESKGSSRRWATDRHVLP